MTPRTSCAGRLRTCSPTKGNGVHRSAAEASSCRSERGDAAHRVTADDDLPDPEVKSARIHPDGPGERPSRRPRFNAARRAAAGLWRCLRQRIQRMRGFGAIRERPGPARHRSLPTVAPSPPRRTSRPVRLRSQRTCHRRPRSFDAGASSRDTNRPVRSRRARRLLPGPGARGHRSHGHAPRPIVSSVDVHRATRLGAECQRAVCDVGTVDADFLYDPSRGRPTQVQPPWPMQSSQLE